ncbi:MAG: DUF4038 domain-containing protein [Sedimentisphaerales bacterium]|nr:DUF4038 domain-containing protein [Sedimentisphaerales bacterium]
MEMKRLSTVFVLGFFLTAALSPFASAQRMKPLVVSENGRFLAEKGGEPFFIMADTAWELFSGLSREDVKFYLDNRKEKGFNTIVCSLLHFGTAGASERGPKHRVYGFWAFDGNHYDVKRPNKQYWNHVDWVIQQALLRDLRLAISPCRFGRSGQLLRDGQRDSSASQFGEYLGLRCCNYNNILWLFGGDSPAGQNRRKLRLMAEGIRFYAPHHLISYNADISSPIAAEQHADRWLSFNSVRSPGREDAAEYALVEANWHRVPAKPTWLAEPCYERPGGRFAIRQAAWRSVLSGGTGFGYGVEDLFNPMDDDNWKKMLDLPGSSDVLHMLELLESQPWEKLVPDHAAKDKLLAAVDVYTEGYLPAACSVDGDFGVVYLPERATIAVDMGKFRSSVSGQWFDPASMESVEATGSPFINAGVHTVRPPELNSTFDSDLVLVLMANAAGPVERNGTTVLGIDNGKFTIDGKQTFLFGISYYGALGSEPRFIMSDLDDMESLGINFIRVWATWGAFENDVSAVDAEGNAREPYISRLKKLVAECNRRGVIVDVTLSRGNGVTGPARLQELDVHRQAIRTVSGELKEYRNWYLDLGNERNITDERFVSIEELRKLRNTAKAVNSGLLVTASRAGDIPELELREYMDRVGIDFVSPHRPRSSISAGQTKSKSRQYLTWMRQAGGLAPLHYQEPFRRGFTAGWEPTVEDFVTDAKAAIEGGASGWCFHNGDQKDAPESKPRRCFDMREARLFEQLDEVEKEALKQISDFIKSR